MKNLVNPLKAEFLLNDIKIQFVPHLRYKNQPVNAVYGKLCKD
jgi:hypothetical protein